MSSSLFDLCSFEANSYYYAPTKYVDGDKKFKDVDKGDILYFVSHQGDHIEEIISNGKLKRSNGKLTLSTNRSGKRFIVDFGTLNYTGTYDGYKNSMVWIPGGYLGTNKQSVISQLIKEQQEELDKLYKQTSSLEFRIEQLNNLK
jgi:hypothetical protein